jgi:hypothetical protein
VRRQRADAIVDLITRHTADRHTNSSSKFELLVVQES